MLTLFQTLIEAADAADAAAFALREEARNHREKTAMLPTLVTRPAFFEEAVPFKGYTSPFTWGQMCLGGSEGGRHHVLNWAASNGPREKTKLQSEITEVTVARAKVCLAVFELRRLIEEAEHFEF